MISSYDPNQALLSPNQPSQNCALIMRTLHPSTASVCMRLSHHWCAMCPSRQQRRQRRCSDFDDVLCACVRTRKNQPPDAHISDAARQIFNTWKTTTVRWYHGWATKPMMLLQVATAAVTVRGGQRGDMHGAHTGAHVTRDVQTDNASAQRTIGLWMVRVHSLCVGLSLPRSHSHSHSPSLSLSLPLSSLYVFCIWGVLGGVAVVP